MVTNSDLAHDLAYTTLKALTEKVNGMPTTQENYSKFRNVQKTAEALFETLTIVKKGLSDAAKVSEHQGEVVR